MRMQTRRAPDGERPGSDGISPVISAAMNFGDSGRRRTAALKGLVWQPVRGWVATAYGAVPGGRRQTVWLSIAEEQEQDENNQKNATNTDPAAIPITAVSVTTSTKQEDDQDYKDDGKHSASPSSEGIAWCAL